VQENEQESDELNKGSDEEEDEESSFTEEEDTKDQREEVGEDVSAKYDVEESSAEQEEVTQDVAEHKTDVEVGSFQEMHEVSDTIRPNISKLQRSGWYSWPLVKNCKAVKANIESKTVHVKPVEVSWSSITRWNNTFKTNDTWTNGEGILYERLNNARPLVSSFAFTFCPFDELGRKILLAIGVKFQFGGRVSGKGRFLKNVRLVPFPKCHKDYDVTETVKKVGSYVSNKYSTKVDPVAVAQFDLEVVSERKTSPTKRSRRNLTFFVLGNGLLLQKRETKRSVCYEE